METGGKGDANAQRASKLTTKDARYNSDTRDLSVIVRLLYHNNHEPIGDSGQVNVTTFDWYLIFYRTIRALR